MPAKRKSVTRIYRGTPRNLKLLARVLRSGGLVGVPTETVYGLAADALDANACREIFVAKGRPTTDPLIVHLSAASKLDEVAEVNPSALLLAKAFWPGALTLVLPKRACVPEIVTAGRPSVAVRVPSHRLFRRLIRLVGRPLAAPSANPFGYVSPTTAQHVKQGLSGKIAYILDGGAAGIGLESTIVDLRDEQHPVVLRPGAITSRQIARVLGRKVSSSSHSYAGPQIAPGQLKRHYSPKKPIQLHHTFSSKQVREAHADAWVFQQRPKLPLSANVFWLSSRGKPADAARRLFGLLRKLDESGFGRIHVELARGAGISDAINDRLRRAAAR